MIVTTLCLMTTGLGFHQAHMDEHYRAWLKPLQAIAKAEGVALCVDVDSVEKPALFHYPKREGMDGLDRLATATGRSWTIADGAYVFRRQLGFDDLRLHTPYQHALSFLTSLKESDRTKLIEGSLSLSLLPRTSRVKLRHAAASMGGGLGDSMLANYPGRVGVRLLFEPTAFALSRTGDGNVSLSLVEESSKVPVPEATSASREPIPLGGPDDGDLDFGDGVILSLSEIVQHARTTLGQQIWIDARLNETRYFMSGRFTTERLVQALAFVTETFVPQVVPKGFGQFSDTQAFRDFRTLAFEPMMDKTVGAGDLTYRDVFDKVDTTFDAIYGAKLPRHVRTFMSQYRIQPTDAVTVTGVMSLAFAAPGLALLPTDVKDSTGRPINANVPHYLKLQLETGQ